MKRNNKYGVSSKYSFGSWSHVVYVFNSDADAQKWLYTEEADFRERELMSRTAAIRLAGKAAVDNAVEYQEECWGF